MIDVVVVGEVSVRQSKAVPLGEIPYLDQYLVRRIAVQTKVLQDKYIAGFSDAFEGELSEVFRVGWNTAGPLWRLFVQTSEATFMCRNQEALRLLLNRKMHVTKLYYYESGGSACLFDIAAPVVYGEDAIDAVMVYITAMVECNRFFF